MILARVVGERHGAGRADETVQCGLSRPIVEYAFLAAHDSARVERPFVATDPPEIAAARPDRFPWGSAGGATTDSRRRRLPTPAP